MKALEYNYRIIKIYHVWHFENTTCYDEKCKKGGIFTDYINDFLKLKQESSGFPSNITTLEEKQKFVDDYFENEGILLDINKIKKNSGIRKIAKILLNSLWGRFSMNTNRTKMKILTKPADFFKSVNDKRYILNSYNFPNENVCQVFYSEIKKLHSGGMNTNVVLGSFVTAYARIKLFYEMILLSTSLLYCDTDSLMYIAKRFHYEPTLGEYLGMFTNHLSDSDSIYVFVSLCSKNYSF